MLIGRGEILRGKIINRAFLNIWGLPDDFVETQPTIADVINYNRYNNIYDVPESEFDGSPEGLIRAVRAGRPVGKRANPLWLLAPGYAKLRKALA